MSDRRRLIADAGLGVLAERGLRGVTHRAVDSAAGLSTGSTSNVFRTKQALVDGLVARLVELDLAALEAADAPPDLSSPAALAAQLAQRSAALTRPPMDTITRARQQLALDPAIDLSAQHEEFVAMATQLLQALGASDPASRARSITDYLDGLIFHVLALRSRTFDVAEATRAIEALIGPCTPTDQPNVDNHHSPDR
ncbi:MAG: TetR/AcrR family transcriptional regulator [Propionibacteriaceae bacterium]|nr:TetR/AcrR family transcriptional regulator [Propionibacteriaceae bacterium]